MITSNYTNVLLLGCGGNAGINFTKCLKMQDGYQVIGLDIDRYKLAASNVDYKEYWDKTKGSKLEFISSLVRKYDIRAIHAQPDPEVQWLAEHKNHFFNLVFPHDAKTKRNFDNKALTAKMWNEYLKLDFLSFSLWECLDDPRLFNKIIERTGKAWIRAIRGAGSKGALPIETLHEGREWATYWQAHKDVSSHDFMISEFLPGREYAVQLFYLRGQEIHSQMRERLVPFFQNQMPSGTSSTPAVARTVYEKEAYQMAERAIRQFDPEPNGIYSVDLKESYQGKIIPIEVNYGRFFTTSDFFASLGVNTPRAYVDYISEGIIDYQIKAIKDEHYWLRGLDHTPVLKRKEEIFWNGEI